LVPENNLWIHPERAKELGISKDDTVEVKSPAGSGKLKVRITEEIREDTVYMDTGFGVLSKGLSNIYGKGACIAEIIEDYNDEISGNMAMHETFVTVKRIAA
jgi:thiosulfate reductase/polysulfide reductase chain A